MTPADRWRIIRAAATASVLVIVWFMLAWDVSVMAVAGGLISAIGVSALSYGVFIEAHEAALHSVLPRPLAAVRYLVVLIVSMYASSLQVLHVVAGGSLNPRVVHFRSKLRSDLARVILAESITFTPGTITLELDDDHLVVHWLSASTTHSTHAADLVKGSLEKAIRRAWM